MDVLKTRHTTGLTEITGTSTTTKYSSFHENSQQKQTLPISPEPFFLVVTRIATNMSGKPCCGGRENKQKIALAEKEETFSIATDYHAPWVWVLVSVLFVGAHVLFFLGQYLILWEIRVIVQAYNVSMQCSVRTFDGAALAAIVVVADGNALISGSSGCNLRSMKVPDCEHSCCCTFLDVLCWFIGTRQLYPQHDEL